MNLFTLYHLLSIRMWGRRHTYSIPNRYQNFSVVLHTTEVCQQLSMHSVVVYLVLINRTLPEMWEGRDGEINPISKDSWSTSFCRTETWMALWEHRLTFALSMQQSGLPQRQRHGEGVAGRESTIPRDTNEDGATEKIVTNLSWVGKNDEKCCW